MPDTPTLIDIDRDDYYEALRITQANDQAADDPPELTFGLACSGEIVPDVEGQLDLLLFTPADLRTLADGLRWLADRADARVAATTVPTP